MAKVRVYSTPTCPYCKMAKEYLRQNNIQFEDIDVSADEEKVAEMINKSGQMGVPVIEIDNQIIVGFDRQKISKALGLP